MWRTGWKTSAWKRTRRGAAIVGYSGPPSRMPSSAVVAAKDSDGSARTRSAAHRDVERLRHTSLRGELMTSVGLRHRPRPVRYGVTGEDGDTVRCAQRVDVNSQLSGRGGSC